MPKESIPNTAIVSTSQGEGENNESQVSKQDNTRISTIILDEINKIKNGMDELKFFLGGMEQGMTELGREVYFLKFRFNEMIKTKPGSDSVGPDQYLISEQSAANSVAVNEADELPY
jgi:hypothetical protein